ncbi:MAG: S-layer homology domain-containing protein [Firmicutes bacterium]|nr:S-layer homology domain-containing protein [Bacillota bacterium]
MFRKIKKAVSLLAAICMLFSLVAVAAEPQQASIMASSATVSQGGNVTIDVSVKDIPDDCEGVAFGISFDENSLSLAQNGIVASDEMEFTGSYIDPGSIGFAGLFANIEAINVGAWVKVASITFAVKSSAQVGDTYLEFINAQYSDIDFDDLTDGKITVTKRSGKFTPSTGGLAYYDRQPDDKEPDDKEPDEKEPDEKEPDEKEPDKPSTPSVDDFSDLGGFDWAKSSIDNLVKKGVISGTSKSTYEPSRSITRAEFTKLIVSVFGFATDSHEVLFNDVSAEDWHFEFVTAAANAGVVTGYPEGGFQPGLSITRQEMAVMVLRSFKAIGVELVQEGAKTYADDNEIADWAKEAISTLSSIGILNGRGENIFAPTDNLTRAEAAVMTNSLLMLLSAN